MSYAVDVRHLHVSNVSCCQLRLLGDVQQGRSSDQLAQQVRVGSPFLSTRTCAFSWSLLHSTHAASNRTAMNAIPEDILVYLTQHWLPNHGGAEIAAGNRIAAPSSLSSIKSHLAQDFDLLGRTGDWNASTQSGNPMHSIQLTKMAKGYNNYATDMGYQKKGAEPLTEAEMHTLLESTCALLNSS